MANNKYRVAIIHHSADMDGLVSGLIAMKLFDILSKLVDIEYDVIGYNYGTDKEKDVWLDTNKVQYDLYQFIDITPPVEWLKGLDSVVAEWMTQSTVEWLPRIEIFDHHEHARKKIYDVLIGTPIKYFFDVTKCGALIYFESITVEKLWLGELISNCETIALGNGTLINRAAIRVFPRLFISKLLRKQIDFWITNLWMLRIVKMVSLFDTWGWFDVWDKSRSYSDKFPLALNEYFFGVEKWNFNAASFYESFFGKENVKLGSHDPRLDVRVQMGYSRIEKLMAEARKREYSVTELYGCDCIMVAGVIGFYEREHVSEKQKDIEREKTLADRPDSQKTPLWYQSADVLCGYRIDWLNRTVKLSFRAIAPEFDCAAYASMISPKNGGGHEGSAGARMSLTEFFELFKLPK